MLNKNIHSFLGCESEYNDAQTVIFGAPFDGTTSFRPGTRFAGSEMRNTSFGIETFSPYQDKDLFDIRVFDGGDLEFPFGNVEKVLKIIKNYTEKVLNDNKKFIMIGGEHLVSLGSIRATAEKYGDLHIIHFDAHADLRNEYLGEQLSHACVMRRAHEIVGDGKIYQFGIRSGDRDEFLFAENHTFMQKFDLQNFKTVVDKLRDKKVYFSLDLDILDPSIFCGTGTPEAGGVSFIQLLDSILLLRKLDIVGADINELSPIYDQSGVSTAVANKILRELLLIITK